MEPRDLLSPLFLILGLWVYLLPSLFVGKLLFPRDNWLVRTILALVALGIVTLGPYRLLVATVAQGYETHLLIAASSVINIGVPIWQLLKVQKKKVSSIE